MEPVFVYPVPVIRRFAGAPYSFVVMNRKAAESVLLEEPHLLISIGTARVEPARHPAQRTRVARLRVAFDDADYLRLEAQRDGLFPDEPEPEYFQARHGEAIREFVTAHRDRVACIACHCEAGMSRSPAVAVALSRWLNDDETVAEAITRWIAVERLGLDDEDVVVWNRLVHDRLLDVLEG